MASLALIIQVTLTRTFDPHPSQIWPNQATGTAFRRTSFSQRYSRRDHAPGLNEFGIDVGDYHAGKECVGPAWSVRTNIGKTTAKHHTARLILVSVPPENPHVPMPADRPIARQTADRSRPTIRYIHRPCFRWHNICVVHRRLPFSHA